MEQIFANARENSWWLYKTVSGAPVSNHISGWFEMYNEAFCRVLERSGCNSSEGYAEILGRMNERPGSPAGESDVEVSAYGLILLDRLNRSQSVGVNLDWFFSQHEALVECYMQVTDAETRSQYAKQMALKKHFPSLAAKAFVLKEWEQYKDAYKGNKSAFARDYVRRVLHEYKVTVTEKQMREVWLKSNPPAGGR